MTGLLVIVFLSQAGVYQSMTTTQVDYQQCITNITSGVPKVITDKDGKQFVAVGLCVDMVDHSI